jgi:hypothetical protein
MRFLTLDGPDDLCGLCRNQVVHAAGESLRNGENSWFLERLCATCDSSSVQTGSGFVPRSLRGLVLGLTGRWRIRVDQGPDVGLPVLRCLRQVYGLSIADVRGHRAELLENGLAGTRGEMEWLASELAAFGVGSSVTLEVAGTQRELPERRMPPAPSRIDGGAAGVLVTIDDEAVRSRIATYLQTARSIVAGGYWIDPVTRDPRDRHGDAVMTDGTYAWSIAWATLLVRHGLPLDGDFIAHVRGLEYAPPKLSDSDLQEVMIATGHEEPAGSGYRAARAR